MTDMHASTSYEPRNSRRRPSLERFDIPYAERVRGHERMRERNALEIVSAQRHWDIARLTLHESAGETELLRGFHIAETDDLLWWPARIMAHSEGLRVIRKHIDPSIGHGDLTELEINLVEHGQLELSWCAAKNPTTNFSRHPVHHGLADGCLAVKGRPIVKSGRILHLMRRSTTRPCPRIPDRLPTIP